MPTLAELTRHFVILSFLAFGGANATLPEIHRLVVEQNQWLAADIFSDLFAISQAAPGPNVLLISLIGLQLSGLGLSGLV
jgi:chromate transporter